MLAGRGWGAREPSQDLARENAEVRREMEEFNVYSSNENYKFEQAK